VSILYDMDALSHSIGSLHTAFSSGPFAETTVLHCFAIKSCPLPYILHTAVAAGMGLEAASLNEVQ
jgi:diaminopimelate decarboxylase